MVKIYTYDEVYNASLKYFNNDELAAKIFVDKYALRDQNSNLLELLPDDMFNRVCRELARIEKDKFKEPLSFEELRELVNFKYICPQGRVLFGCGNLYQYVTCANCYSVPSPLDSYSGIHYTDEHITQISKRGAGIGVDI